MLQGDDTLDFLSKRLSVRLNKPMEEFESIIKILQTNWYDTIHSLVKLTEQDYTQMNIPHRIAVIICEEVTTALNNNKNNTQKQKQTKIESKMQEIIEEKPIKQTQTLDEDSMKKICKKLFQQLTYQKKQNTQMLPVVETLFKIVSNICKDPYQMKFRRLKKANKMISNNITQVKGSINFIKSIGFIQNQESYELNSFQVHHLLYIEEILENIISHIKEKINKKDNSSNKKVDNEKMFIDFQSINAKYLNNQQEQMKQPQRQINSQANEHQINSRFSEEKLSEMKYYDAFEQLMQLRNEIMSTPAKRQLKIYHKKFENKNLVLHKTTFQEQISHSSDKAVAAYWKNIITENKKNQSFRSKRKLEFEQLIKQKIYKETLIKIKLPNQLIIEAYFGPLQTLRAVFKFVSEIVIGDLYLFTTPPVKKMDKQMDKTLNDLEAVPMGNFYLGSNIQWYIQGQYVPLIKK